MAGIGFQLRKIIGRGNLYETIGALVSGVFIVAGPWLISVVAMVILQGAFSREAIADIQVFQAVVVYCYAFSLSLFSALHHHFTRIIADLVWESRHGEAASWMLRFLLLAGVLSLGLAIPAAYFIPLELDRYQNLFKIGMVLLFLFINLLWIIMLFISLLKRYSTILIVFVAGMGLSVLGSPMLASAFGVTGALLGYTAGIVLIDVIFLVIALIRYRPVQLGTSRQLFWKYLLRYSPLITAGFFFYAGQWLDKLYFWFFQGQKVPGIGLFMFPNYDYAVYVAGLSIIPGLVYFVIIAETQIYVDTRHFLYTLTHSPWMRIQEAKQSLLQSLQDELRDQSLLQGFCSLAFAFILFHFGPDTLKSAVMAFALGAAFFQFTLMTILVFLYYFELYRQAMGTALLYFVLNGPVMGLFYELIPNLYPGAGHLIAGSLACLWGFQSLRNSTRRIEKILFMRALGMKV